MWQAPARASGLVVALLLLALVPAAGASHSIVPGAPVGVADVLAADAASAAEVGAGFASYAVDASQRYAGAALAGAQGGAVPLPFAFLGGLVGRATADAQRIEDAAVHGAVASVGAAAGSASDAVALTKYTVDVAQRRSGVGLEDPMSEYPPLAAACVGGDLQRAVDAALPGEEVLVCAGTYGPVVVRQHFVTLRAEQGPAATFLEGGGGTAVTILGTGVILRGFTIQGADGPGAAAVAVGARDGSEAGSVAGVVVQDNVIRRSTVGVAVWKAPGTAIVGNTIRDTTTRGDPAGGVGVLVAPADAAEGAPVVVAANNLVNHPRYSVRSALPGPGAAAVPTLAVLNYYGSATGPNVDLLGTCVGAGLATGETRCRNAVGEGVVPVGFSPVAL